MFQFQSFSRWHTIGRLLDLRAPPTPGTGTDRVSLSTNKDALPPENQELFLFFPMTDFSRGFEVFLNV